MQTVEAMRRHEQIYALTIGGIVLATLLIALVIYLTEEILKSYLMALICGLAFAFTIVLVGVTLGAFIILCQSLCQRLYSLIRSSKEGGHEVRIE